MEALIIKKEKPIFIKYFWILIKLSVIRIKIIIIIFDTFEFSIYLY